MDEQCAETNDKLDSIKASTDIRLLQHQKELEQMRKSKEELQFKLNEQQAKLKKSQEEEAKEKAKRSVLQ